MTSKTMAATDSVSADELFQHIAKASPAECKAMLRKVDCPWLDFSEAYLNRLSLDQLRHITAAACIRVELPKSVMHQ